MWIIILIQIIKWMPPYWDNNALPHNFLTLYFIFIENKCFSDVIWNFEKGEKNFAKRWIWVDRVKMWKTYIYHLHH